MKHRIIIYTLLMVSIFIVLGWVRGKVQEWSNYPVIEAMGVINDIVKPSKIVKKIVSTMTGGKTDDGQLEANNNSEEKKDLHFKNDLHLDLGVYSSFIPASPKYLYPKVSVGLSFFSYGGESKDRWRFVRVGVGGMVNSGVDVTLSPVMYNIGNLVPIFSNTYVHPFIGYNITNARPIMGIQFSLSF
jgi:hypothetical protein